MKQYLTILLASLLISPAFAQDASIRKQDDPEFNQGIQKFIEKLTSCTSYKATMQQPLSNDPNEKMKAEIVSVGNTCHYKLILTNMTMDCAFNAKQLREIKDQGKERLNEFLNDRAVCPYSVTK